MKRCGFCHFRNPDGAVYCAACNFGLHEGHEEELSPNPCEDPLVSGRLQSELEDLSPEEWDKLDKHTSEEWEEWVMRARVRFGEGRHSCESFIGGSDSFMWGDSSQHRTPNDDRSNSFNPNNSASKAATDNRSNQLNPNNPAFHHSPRRK